MVNKTENFIRIGTQFIQTGLSIAFLLITSPLIFVVFVIFVTFVVFVEFFKIHAIAIQSHSGEKVLMAGKMLKDCSKNMLHLSHILMRQFCSKIVSNWIKIRNQSPTLLFLIAKNKDSKIEII